MTFCGTAAGFSFTLGRQIWVFDDCSSGFFQHFVLSVAIRGLRAPLRADVFVWSHLQGIVDCHGFLLSSILAVLVRLVQTVSFACATLIAPNLLPMCGTVRLSRSGTSSIRSSPTQVDTVLVALSDPPASSTHFLGSVNNLPAVGGFESPDWSSLAQRPPQFFRHQFEPGVPVRGRHCFAVGGSFQGCCRVARACLQPSNHALARHCFPIRDARTTQNRNHERTLCAKNTQTL